MAEDVKKVIIEVKAETRQATESIRKLTAQVKTLERQQAKSNIGLKKTTRTLNKITGSFKTLSAHLARLIVIYGSFEALTNTITTFANFEQSIKNLGAISGASGKELEKLRDKALELGKTTVFTASQVVGGMTEMARAGLNTQQQLDGIRAVLSLSIDGLMNLSDATKVSVTTMHEFGLKAKDMGMISDVLVASINSSAQNLDELSNALAKVGPVAHEQNISLQETVSVLGFMANAGIRAELAGTQLKILLTRLGSNNKVTKYLNSMGISMYDVSTHKLLPLIDRLKILKKTMDGMSAEKRASFGVEVAGTRALASMDVMLGKIKQIQLQTSYLKNSFGVADTEARKMMNTLIGSWKTLQSALQNLEILTGKNMSGALKNIVQDATDFIRELSPKDIEAFSNSLASVIKTTYDFGKILARVGVIAVKIGEFFSPTGNISAGMIFITALIYKFRTALISLADSNPVLLALIGTISIVISSLNDYQMEVQSFKNTNTDFMNSLKGINDANQQYIKDNIKGKITLQQLREDIGKFSDAIAFSNRKLRIMKSNIANLKNKQKNSWLGLTAEEQLHLKELERTYKLLSNNVLGAMKDRNHLAELASKKLDEENQTRSKNNQLTAKSTRLTKDEITAVEEEIQSYKEREATARNTLNSMIKKETSYYNKITKLENKLAQTRTDYANKRAILNANFENEIDNIRDSSLPKIQQYNDAQLRADKELANAKAELTKGNLALAKNYMSIYNSLITQQTSTEIKDGKTVLKTKLELNNELIANKKRGHQVELEILKEEENRAIKIINNQIDLEKNKIKLNKVQMDIQLQILELQTKSVDVMNKGLNGKYDTDIKKARDEVAKLSAEALKLTEKQRTIKINAILNKNDLAKGIKDVGDNTTITPKVNTDKVKQKVEKTKPVIMIITDTRTGKVVEKVNILKKKIEKPTITIIETDTKEADNKISILKNKAKKPTKSLHTIKVNDSAVLKAKAINSKNTSSTHTIYVRTVQQHATGGFIRRQGALSGYGGGDRVKALLEDGEFIVRKEAVRQLGINRLQTINQGIIPKYATGGLVGIGTPQKLIEQLSNSFGKNDNGGNGLDSSNWDDLISKLRDLISGGTLPDKFNNIFKNMLSEAEKQQQHFSSIERNDQNNIKSAQNSTLGKIQTPEEAKKSQSVIASAQNKLQIDTNAEHKKLEEIKDKLADYSNRLKRYLLEVKTIKEKIESYLKTYYIDIPIDAKNSLDLERLERFKANIENPMRDYVYEPFITKLDAYKKMQQLYYNGSPSDKRFLLNKDFVSSSDPYNQTWYNGKYAKWYNTSILPKFKTGGLLKGYGGGDRNLSLLEDGEFVIRKEAVKTFGADLFRNLNNLSLPKFQTGGYVGTTPTQQNLDNVNLNFTLPSGNTYKTITSSEVAKALGNELRKML